MIFIKNNLSFLVHILTASGVICSYMCITNIFKKEIEICFFWLGIALIIDVIDGPIARKLDVKNKYPSLNGLMLDTIVDYINWIFLPVLILFQFDLIYKNLEFILVPALLLIPALSYSTTITTNPDRSYSGMPAIWNLLAVFFFLAETSVMFNSSIMILFLILKFLPVNISHPFRTKKLFYFNSIFAFVWITTSTILIADKIFVNSIISSLVQDLWYLSSSYFVFSFIYSFTMTVSKIRLIDKNEFTI